VDLEEEVIICEHADALKIYQPDEKTEITILTGAVRIKMTNGFLHAKKVTMYKDIATETFQKTLAEGDVELRDKDIFATCYQAILNHLDNTVDLKEQVIVIQEDDRLEADHFVFNRRTGERTGDGNVKFRVRIRNSKQTTSPDATTPPTSEPTKIEEASSTENSDDDSKADPTN
jgi:lipopolysaccharide export system protein LptA